jgi:hypothetical protein
MRVPQFERFAKLVQLFGVLLVGMVLGSAVYHSVYHYNFNRLLEMIGSLEEQLHNYKKEVEELDQYKQNKTVIRRLLVHFVPDPDGRELDEIIENELRKRLKRDLSVMIGRDVYRIGSDSQLARQLLHNKIYADVHGADYRVNINTILVIDGVLQVWATARVHAVN